MRQASATIPSTSPARATRAARGASSKAPEHRYTCTSRAPRLVSADRAPASNCSTISPFQRVAQIANRSASAFRAGSGVGAFVDMRSSALRAERLLLLLGHEREKMTHLVPLHLQVVGIVLRMSHLDRYPLHHFQVIELLEAVDLLRVVRHQAHLAHAAVPQDLSADPVVAQVGFEPELVVRLDRVVPVVLQIVGAQLVDETDAAPFLVEVDEHTLSGFVDHLQGAV